MAGLLWAVGREAVPILRNVRRLPDPTRRLIVSEDAADRLGGAVPAPAFAFLLTLISLSSLFWLVTLKRTTLYTAPELWLMSDVIARFGVRDSRRLAAEAYHSGRILLTRTRAAGLGHR